MNKTNEPEPSNWQVFNISIILLLLGLASLYFAITVTVELYSGTVSQASIIYFNKAGFYFYGIAIVLLVFPIIVICKKIFKFKISKQNETRLNYVLLFGILLTIAVPHLTHYYFEPYIKKVDYQICKGKSDRALYTVKIIYTKPGQCIGVS